VARINLIGWRNQAGLSRDLALLQDVLTGAGHEVRVNGLTPPRRLKRLWLRLRSGGPPWDLAIFVEKVVPSWMELARHNVLIPNPEWLEETPGLRRVDAVWTKTRFASEALGNLGLPLREIGFSTLDRGHLAPERDGTRQWHCALHVAGRNRTKGTAPILDIWRRHPEWPSLTVVAAWSEPQSRPADLPPNIQLVDHFLDDTRLAALQRQCGLHLCPSEVEGFGHTLVEGMSVGAVVLTTDAAPMSEIVAPTRGFLVPAQSLEPMRRGHRARVEPALLEEAVAQVLGLPESRLQEIGREARDWFEANDRAFRQRLVSAVEALLLPDARASH